MRLYLTTRWQTRGILTVEATPEPREGARVYSYPHRHYANTVEFGLLGREVFETVGAARADVVHRSTKKLASLEKQVEKCRRVVVEHQ